MVSPEGTTHTCGAGYSDGRLIPSLHELELGGAHEKTRVEYQRYPYRLGGSWLDSVRSRHLFKRSDREVAPIGDLQGPALRAHLLSSSKSHARSLPGLNLLTVCLLLLLLAGCATNAKYSKVLQTWVGSDVNRLIESWGPPSQRFDLPNGKIMYTWLYVGGNVIVGNYNYYLNMVTARSVAVWCKTTFTIEPSGRIETWRWEGNACRAK